jgi:hypothetical protein
VLRALLVAIGLLSGSSLPYFEGNSSVLTVVVQSAYGALAGWAVGAIIAHLLGER